MANRTHPFATRGGLRAVRPKQPAPQPPEPLPVLPSTEKEACERLERALYREFFYAEKASLLCVIAEAEWIHALVRTQNLQL